LLAEGEEVWPPAEVAVNFPISALRRAMQIKEVLLRAMNKEFSWLRAAEILGITPRGLRRLRQRMEQFGYQGLVDMRHGRPSPRKTPVAEIERILALYRDRYRGFNARHFCSMVRREHGVTLSYSCVKQILQGAGLVEKRKARGRHRMRRPRRSRFGQMLHLDGSTHPWLALVPEEKQTLIQSVDDATSRVLYAQLWPGETVRAVMTAMAEIIGEYGIPESFYTDRAGWAFETPKAGAKVSKTLLTQVGEALKRLGVEHIPSYSPQGRGRSERMNRTLQDRLVNELRAAGITTVEAANRYLRERYRPAHNAEFSCEPADPTSSFVALGEVELSEIFYESDERTVRKDNTVSVGGVVLQIAKQPARQTCSGVAVEVRRHLDGGYSIHRGKAPCWGCYDATGQARAVGSLRQVAAITTASLEVDPKAVPAIRTHRRSNRTIAGAVVPVSGRLRLPPAGTTTSPTLSKP
jgi:transposase